MGSMGNQTEGELWKGSRGSCSAGAVCLDNVALHIMHLVVVQDSVLKTAAADLMCT